MKKLLALLLVGGLLGLTTGCPNPTTKPGSDKQGAGAQGKGEPSKAEKLVGQWSLEKSVDKEGKPPKAAPPPGSIVLEFTKEGAFKVNAGGLKMDGTYKLDGDKITSTMKGPDNKEKQETNTIMTLTDKELVTKDDKGNTDTFKRK